MPRRTQREDIRLIFELLGLKPLAEQISRTATGTGRFYARSMVQLQALLLPAAVFIALAAYATGAVALAVRKARTSGGRSSG